MWEHWLEKRAQHTPTTEEDPTDSETEKLKMKEYWWKCLSVQEVPRLLWLYVQYCIYYISIVASVCMDQSLRLILLTIWCPLSLYVLKQILRTLNKEVK